MFKRLTIVLLLVVSGFSTALAFANNAEEKKLLRIFDEIWQYDMTRDPTYATYVGYPGQNGLWPDVSQAAVAADTEKRREFLAKLRKINRKRLGDDSLLDWQLVEKNLAGQVDSSEFPDQYILIHQRGGVQQGIAETLSMMPQRNRQDFQDQLTRLTNASAYI